MTVEEIRAEFERWTFRMPGYSWRLRLDSPPADPPSFASSHWPTATLQITVATEDSTGELRIAPGDRFSVVHTYRMPLEEFRAPEVLGEWLRRSVQATVVHEALEWIRRDDVMVFNPHEMPF